MIFPLAILSCRQEGISESTQNTEDCKAAFGVSLDVAADTSKTVFGKSRPADLDNGISSTRDDAIWHPLALTIPALTISASFAVSIESTATTLLPMLDALEE